MATIKFKAAFGDQDADVELSQHNGGGGHYHIYVNRFYCGMIMMQHGKWAIHLNPKSDKELTTDDRMILVDIIIDSLRIS